jgi:hypothetical protein
MQSAWDGTRPGGDVHQRAQKVVRTAVTAERAAAHSVVVKYSSRTQMRRENFLRDEEYSRLYFALPLIGQHVPFALKVTDRYAVSNARMRPTNTLAPISELCPARIRRW